MPQDPNLYGQRAPKRQKKDASLPSSLAFSAELSSLISSAKDSASSRPRPPKSSSKSDILSSVKVKKRKGADGDHGGPRDGHGDKNSSSNNNNNRLGLKQPIGTEDEKKDTQSARRRMEEKARLYAAMKRGDYVPKEGEAAPLVDFDRKWAQAQQDGGNHPSSDDDDDDYDSDNIDTEIITYTDEFGRQRTGTRAEKARMDRAARAREYGAAEAERMSARPKAPERVIYGDAVQAEAFRAADEDAMEALARKRDRSLTPPEMKHYEADKEIRTKGVGFFQFSKDEEARKREMEALARERENTEQERKRREEERETRKREVEERRRLIEERRRQAGEKRARKMADSFLDGLAADLGGVGREDG